MARQTSNRAPDSQAMRLTRYVSVGQRIRDELEHRHGTQLRGEFEARWPDMAEALARLVELVDEDAPMVPVPTGPLWTHPVVDHAGRGQAAGGREQAASRRETGG